MSLLGGGCAVIGIGIGGAMRRGVGVVISGQGFGLGFSVNLDPVAAGGVGSAGEYAWGGAASTYFWVDPEEEIVVVFMTQLLGSSTYPLRPHLMKGVGAALLD